LGFLALIKLSKQTMRGTCYSAFLTGFIHCPEIMLIGGDIEGSLGKGSWWDGLRDGRLIFVGIIKACVVCSVFTCFCNVLYFGNPAMAKESEPVESH